MPTLSDQTPSALSLSSIGSKVLADYSGPYDLQVSKTLSGTVSIGQTVDFVISYINSGSATLTGVYIKDIYTS